MGKYWKADYWQMSLFLFFSVDISLQNISSLTASIDENLRQPYILSKKNSIWAITSSDIYSE